MCVHACVCVLFMYGNKDILTYQKLNKQFVCIFRRYSPDIHPWVVY